MKISVNSQLGLMMDDKQIQIEFLKLMMKRNEDLANAFQMISDVIKDRKGDDADSIIISDEEIKKWYDVTGQNTDSLTDLTILQNNRDVKDKVGYALSDGNKNMVDNENGKIYLICKGVEDCSKMIRIGDNFSSRALRNIEFGKHTYLMGKNEVCRFLCGKGVLKGIYWNRSAKVCFEFGFDLDGDGYYFDELYADYFNKVAKIITFVELGDIEVIEIEKGRNNGKTKANGKITNGANYTVYVVDSSWNQLIIRTDGFAVMGHFRLQPCGAGLIDRKLIWINAFEKYGYTRRPKAEIIHQ